LSLDTPPDDNIHNINEDREITVQRVHGLFFDIVLGEVASLIDSSGSGKAILLNIIVD